MAAEQQQQQQQEEPNILRSMQSNDRCLIRFTNCTQRKVDVLWVNFTGQFVQYSVLEPGEYVNINTYKTHPWLAVDSVTGDNLHLNKKFVHMPQTTEEYTRRPMPDKRLSVLITLPVYSLRLRALLEVRNRLKKEEDVDDLEVTAALKKELKAVISRRNKVVVSRLLRIA